MTEVDLHKLADIPGAGNAAKELRKAGRPLDPEDTGDEWNVEVEYSVGYRDFITVKAFSAEDARQKASAKVRDYPGSGFSECVEIYSVQVEERDC